MIKIPQLCLVALVGASGSGKSTFAARHFLPTQVLPSDTFQGLVADDEDDQSATADAFDLLYQVAAARLRRGRLTVVDATNVQAHARATLLKVAKAHDVLPVAIVLDVPEALCWERIRGRTDRRISRATVARQHRDLRASLKRLRREGFRYVYTLNGPEEIDAAQITYTRLFSDWAGDWSGTDRGDRSGTALCVAGNHEQKLLHHLRGRKVRVSHGLDDGRLVMAHAGLKEEYHGRSSGRVRSFALYGDTTGETDEYGLPVRYPWARDYRTAGVDQVVCQEKHMGSRAVVLVCRDPEVGQQRFGTRAAGVLHTRTGRSFFSDPTLTSTLLRRIARAVEAADLWAELDTGWLLLDTELLPWSAKAHELIDDVYAGLDRAAGAALPAARAVLAAAAERGLELGDLPARLARRHTNAEAFATAYRRYVHPTDGLTGVSLAPFAVLASEGTHHAGRDHSWHLAMASRSGVGTGWCSGSSPANRNRSTRGCEHHRGAAEARHRVVAGPLPRSTCGSAIRCPTWHSWWIRRKRPTGWLTSCSTRNARPRSFA